MPYQHALKINIIGNSNTGKTALTRALAGELFNSDYKNYENLRLVHCTLKEPAEKISDFAIWDTSGAEHARRLTEAYYRGADVILLCCALNAPLSFDQLSSYLSAIKKERAQARVIIVGTKSDLIIANGEKPESICALKSFATHNQCEFIYTSAKDHIHINELFTRITALPKAQTAQWISIIHRKNTGQLLFVSGLLLTVTSLLTMGFNPCVSLACGIAALSLFTGFALCQTKSFSHLQPSCLFFSKKTPLKTSNAAFTRNDDEISATPAK